MSNESNQPGNGKKDRGAFWIAIFLWLVLSLTTAITLGAGEIKGRTVMAVSFDEFLHRLPLRMVLWGILILILFRSKNR